MTAWIAALEALLGRDAAPLLILLGLNLLGLLLDGMAPPGAARP